MLKFTNVAHETAQLDIQHFALIVFFIRLQILNFYIDSVNRKPSNIHSLKVRQILSDVFRRMYHRKLKPAWVEL